MPKKNDTHFAPAPLLCWDIFMQGYQRKLATADDFSRLNKLSLAKNWINEWDYETRLFREQKVIIVTDPLLRIVYASSNVFDMNGYTAEEIKGRTATMFQGENTSVETRMVMRTAIKNLKAFDTTILNYRKNQRPYYCHIEGYPVFNKHRELANFIAFESVVRVSDEV